MKTNKNIILIIGLVFFCINQVIANEKPKVLFIGNSYTYFNDMPEMVKSIADSKGDSIEIRESTHGGWSMFQFIEYQPTLDAIHSEKWDYVVLQEGGYLEREFAFASQECYPYVLMMQDIIKENNPHTKVILILFHGQRYGFPDLCQYFQVYCTYEGDQTRIKEGALIAGNILDCKIAPCGMVWWEMRKTNDNLPYYSSDNYHPAPLGSYIDACTIYSAIFENSPEDAYVINGVDSATAALVHNKVSDVMYNNLSDWNQALANALNINPYTFMAMDTKEYPINQAFRYELPKYVFIDDDSLDISVVESGKQTLPDYLYYDKDSAILTGVPENKGSVNLKFTATDIKGSSASSILHLVFTSETGMDNNKAANFKTYPNPAQKTLQIGYPGLGQKSAYYKIIDLSGKTVHEGKLTGNTIDVSRITKGTYLLNIDDNENILTSKFIIK